MKQNENFRFRNEHYSESINTSDTGNPGIRLNRTILISFCRQTATGMEFLSQKRVIHTLELHQLYQDKPNPSTLALDSNKTVAVL
ncbi:unnamed protein product [Allacma fusca]|uniref:Uncharacterized protein n=1 Tax=Allacma fusca TaxID=39272 RepID=A0A8J2NV26_9HEXA|nr:unnamed protein product [Allacma fusca]